MIAGLRTRAATTDQYLRLIAPAWSQRATYGDGLTRFEATTAAGYAVTEHHDGVVARLPWSCPAALDKTLTLYKNRER